MMPSLILAVLAQIALTFVLLAWTALSRSKAIKADRSLAKRAAIDNSLWPDRSVQVSNCYNNQFQLPVLFYMVILFYLTTGGTSLVMGILAWVFVILRIVHMIIHTGTNHLLHRFMAFGAGMVTLLVMWIVFAIHYFT